MMDIDAVLKADETLRVLAKKQSQADSKRALRDICQNPMAFNKKLYPAKACYFLVLRPFSIKKARLLSETGNRDNQSS